MLKVALIGCGRILAKHLDALAENTQRWQLVAVCDLLGDKAEAAGEGAAVPSFTDLDDMLRQVDCDLVGVLTDSGSHANVAVRVMRDHNKPVLVEKPMGMNAGEAQEMM
ncbi:MAG: Gfo/Idh/MocA family oxidoreductase, partial [Myxococcota bacterium]|nr:Gfo/Idh/MocA family oxidoreductase [Myxococcota bacterium]